MPTIANAATPNSVYADGTATSPGAGVTRTTSTTPAGGAGAVPAASPPRSHHCTPSTTRLEYAAPSAAETSRKTPGPEPFQPSNGRVQRRSATNATTAGTASTAVATTTR